MLDFGREFADKLTLPAVFELIGDVGTGKTTFTRGLAEGLNISEPVTSPSFTISKRYAFQRTARNEKTTNQPSENQPSENQLGELVHYDFYRLDDPGIMSEELAETLSEPNHVVVIEWGNSIAELLPDTKYSLRFDLQPDGSRQVTMNEPAAKCWEQK